MILYVLLIQKRSARYAVIYGKKKKKEKSERVHYGKSLIFVFQDFFASIDKIFILAWGLGTRLSFYEVFILF